MADNSKDVIYIDIDDEITGIIDKVKASGGRIIALVLPKRAAVFQSIVNMKLLKRAADEDKKRLVLITSEAGLLPLAGAVGMHVAKNLQSKPEIPAGPAADSGEEEIEEADLPNDEMTAETAGDRPIGELAGASLARGALTTDEALETVELDNDEPGGASPSAAPLPLAAKAKKDKKLKVPNFNRFRLWLVLLILLLILGIIGFVVANGALAKAVINIKTNASNLNTNLSLTLDTNASKLDPTADVVPAKQVQEQKTYSQQVPTTGQQNQGNKASGTVTMTDCVTGLNFPQDVPAGSGISSNGLTFITQQDTTFSSVGSPDKANGCYQYQATSPTSVVAMSAGSQYNISASTFTVAGRSDVTAKSTAAFTGGTDNIVKVVAQADIDAAKAKITTQDSGVKQDLQSQLQQQGYYAVAATFNAGTPTVTTSANVGDAADNVTVTEVVAYTMLGAKQNDLTTLLHGQINSQINPSQQSILDDGLSTASIHMTASNANSAQISLQTTAIVGPQLSIASIKQQAAGKKSGDVQNQLKNIPGVTSVSIKLSPFWVSSIPKNTAKITVNIAKPTNTINANNP